MSGLASGLPLPNPFCSSSKVVSCAGVFVISDFELGLGVWPAASVFPADSMARYSGPMRVKQGRSCVKQKSVKWDERPHLSELRSAVP